jgi:hypothetical protein
MKTDTVNINKWEVNEAASNSYDIINHGLNNTRINIKTTDYRNAATLKIKENAELIVAAVNACKDINPDNPLKVASHLVEFVEMYKKLHAELEHFINATPTGDKRVQLTGLNILALWQLNQVTE